MPACGRRLLPAAATGALRSSSGYGDDSGVALGDGDRVSYGGDVYRGHAV
jgi:hypothetical protein